MRHLLFSVTFSMRQRAPFSLSVCMPIIWIMFSSEIMELLVQVITSWQVIAVTVALVLYIRIVTYVAKDHGPRYVIREKTRRKKARKAPPGPEEVVAAPGASVNEELGLEEA